MNTEEMHDKLKADYQQAQADWQAMQDSRDAAWQEMKDDHEARLKGIADAQLALAELETTELLDSLWLDYNTIREEWRLALHDLDRQLTALADAKREKADYKETLKITEYMATIAQENKAGAINGTNEPRRKKQAALYLHDLAKVDPDYKALLRAARELDSRIDDLEISVERLKGTISYLRNSARLAAGLAHALAG